MRPTHERMRCYCRVGRWTSQSHSLTFIQRTPCICVPRWFSHWPWHIRSLIGRPYVCRSIIADQVGFGKPSQKFTSLIALNKGVMTSSSSIMPMILSSSLSTYSFLDVWLVHEGSPNSRWFCFGQVFLDLDVLVTQGMCSLLNSSGSPHRQVYQWLCISLSMQTFIDTTCGTLRIVPRVFK